MSEYDLIIVGGGAAGFFGAINAAVNNPSAKILLIEKGTQLLGKVKVSGGGRCNVTHACFEPKELVRFYPRGEQELLGPFHQFMTTDTIAWFEQRGIELKVEQDNRMFPKSNSSQTIIDCFLSEAKNHGIEIRTQCGMLDLEYKNALWNITTEQGDLQSKNILVTTGSSPLIWNILQKLGHHIIDPVPSLFTFNIKDNRISSLPGLSVPEAKVSIKDLGIETEGPLLITHWGMSGPAILRASAWGARKLAEVQYKALVFINWIGLPPKEVLASLKKMRDSEGKKLTGSTSCFGLPSRLWKSLTDHCGISDIKWASLSNKQIEDLAKELSAGEYHIDGKSTFKEEFVTSGGIDLSEVNMKTMESKVLPHLFFAGEVLNIDAITGGFNFQAAWTTSWIAAQHCL